MFSVQALRLRASWVVAEPHRAFLVLALFSGLTLVLLNPPLQGPDEVAHLRRAYHVSEGRVLAHVMDQRVGDDLPKSLRSPRFLPFYVIPGHLDARVGAADYAAAWSVRLNSEKRHFVDFNNTALYSPVPYAPQALGLALARVLRIRPLMLLYLSRLAGLATWVGLVWAAILVIPTGKWLFFLLALAPTSISMAAVLSADTVTNGLAFLTIAVLVRHALSRARIIGWRDVAWITCLTVLLALTKFVYVTLALLFLAMPADRAGSPRRYWSMAGVVIGLSALACLAWSMVAGRLVVPYGEYNPRVRDFQALIPGTDPPAKVVIALHHPVVVLGRLLASIVRDRLWARFASWIDWDVVLPAWFAWVWLFLCVVVARIDGNADEPLGTRLRFLLLGLASATVFLFYLIHYFTWTPLGAPYVEGISGRYLTPVAPALLLPLSADRQLALKGRIGQILVPLVAASHLITLWALIRRYFIP